MGRKPPKTVSCFDPVSVLFFYITVGLITETKMWHGNCHNLLLLNSHVTICYWLLIICGSFAVLNVICTLFCTNNNMWQFKFKLELVVLKINMFLCTYKLYIFTYTLIVSKNNPVLYELVASPCIVLWNQDPNISISVPKCSKAVFPPYFWIPSCHIVTI